MRDELTRIESVFVVSVVSKGIHSIDSVFFEKENANARLDELLKAADAEFHLLAAARTRVILEEQPIVDSVIGELI